MTSRSAPTSPPPLHPEDPATIARAASTTAGGRFVIAPRYRDRALSRPRSDRRERRLGHFERRLVLFREERRLLLHAGQHVAREVERRRDLAGVERVVRLLGVEPRELLVGDDGPLEQHPR